MIVRVIARLSTAALCGISESPEKSLFENTPKNLFENTPTSRLLTDSGVWGVHCTAIATSLPEGAGSTQSKPAAPNLLDLRCSRRTQGCHATCTKCGYSPRPPRRSYPSAQPLVAAFISCLLAREGQPAAGGILYRRCQRATPSTLSPAPALCAPSLTTRCHLRCAGSSRRATDMPSRAWTLSHPQPTRTTTAPIQAINSNTRNLPQAPEGGPGPPLGGGARGGIPGHPFRDTGGAFGRVVTASLSNLYL